jgi:hypothetical protein
MDGIANPKAETEVAPAVPGAPLKDAREDSLARAPLDVSLPVDAFLIGAKRTERLREAGLATVGAVAAASDDRLSGIYDIGPNTVRLIRAKIGGSKAPATRIVDPETQKKRAIGHDGGKFLCPDCGEFGERRARDRERPKGDQAKATSIVHYLRCASCPREWRCIDYPGLR